MSWLRNAVNLAVEAGAGKSLTRTVRNYADTVVLHAGNAVAGGAKLILPDRIGPRNLQSFKHTVKRLEEVSVSCRGIERVQLLRRWLVALKEIERLTAIYNYQERNSEDHIMSDENSDSPKRPTLVYYVDADMGDEPKTFRDVFLHSQALEGITLSMILEEPTEEEVSLLLEIYGLCLTGGREVHGVVMSSVQNLAKALSFYQDEVLIKREELLQLAQNAISGLKINADLTRIDAEACSIREELDKLMALQQPLSESYNNSSETERDATVENLKAALVEIQLCSRLESLLLKKKSLSNGDSPELHTEKVEKLKVLSESLANSTSQAEKRILDHRYQKEEALNFRVAKANEVSQLEKDLVAEIAQTERQREELQEALKKVIISLNVLRGRLHNAREEREQFDEASNQIIVHLKSKEDELSRSIDSCRAEVDVVNTWICFLEDTWVLQASYTEKKEKQVNEELEKYGGYFVNLVIHLLSTYKESLRSSITCIRNLVERMRLTEGSSIPLGKDDGSSSRSNPRKNIEEEYLDVEAKLLTTLSVVDTMKRQFYVQNEGIYRKDGQKVKELFNDLKNIKDEFDSIERPVLVIEASPRKPDTPPSDGPFLSPTPTSTSPLGIRTPFFKRDGSSKSSLFKKEKKLDQNEESVKLDPPLATRSPHSSSDKEEKKSEPKVEAKLYRGLDIESREGSAEFEITDWVFDELEKSVDTPSPAKEITTASAKENTTAPSKDITTALAKEITTAPPSKDITTTPPSKENTTVALPQENATAPSKENTLAPAKENTTATPSKECTTAPAKEITTAPAEEKITAPVKEITTVPAKEITPAPAQENITAVVKEITTVPPSKDITTTPAQENTTAPAKEVTTAPANENATANANENTTPPSQVNASAHASENTTVDPNRENTTTASAKENTTTAPSQVNAAAHASATTTAVPTKETTLLLLPRTTPLLTSRKNRPNA
ncbi:PREDICTED: uncharacterized protein LOC101299220 isoform X1 [Fragaria vesca subsp. vesca]|uniref:uncharacterized protein LOC101299220 isoform X1 n=1 Tax=Fragaria vesca subsp. vesca TaxID=101020 RepID=UPI0002C363AE|nr:PREDICTED: uncharacterized protein LOC101299220 isoform X1 [Fragaria vesca subsp. vesca]